MPGASNQGGRRTPTDAVERLYVMWMIGTLALLLLVAIVTLVGTGRLAQQAESIRALESRLAALEAGALPVDTRRQPPASKEPPAPPPAPPDGPTERPRPRPTEPQAPPAEPPPAQPPQQPAMTPDELSRRLDVVMRPGSESAYEVSDAAGGAALLDEWAAADVVIRDGALLARLAALGALLGRDALADECARAALEAGVLPAAYFDVAIQSALEQADWPLARRLAAEYVGRSQGAAAARVRAAWAWAWGPERSLGVADELVSGLDAPEALRRLTPAQRVRLGELMVVLENWRGLGAVVTELGDVPDRLRFMRDWLRAVEAVRAGRLVEALAVLDYLVELAPDNYDVLTWRGVGLVEARSYEAARAALAHAERYPQRPEAWYWRGVLALRQGDVANAERDFEAALAASPDYCAAHEALASLLLERPEVEAAIDRLTLAVESNPRRAISRLLRAVAHAKAGRREPTVADLRAALTLDPLLLEVAQNTEVLTRLVPVETMVAMAQPPAPASNDQ